MSHALLGKKALLPAGLILFTAGLSMAVAGVTYTGSGITFVGALTAIFGLTAMGRER